MREAHQVLGLLKTKSRERYVPPYYTALLYAGLGQKDEAFEWLEKALQDRHWMMAFLKWTRDGMASDQTLVLLTYCKGQVWSKTRRRFVNARSKTTQE